MPRNALRSKVCGERSEDFCAALRHKSNGIFEGCQKSPDFSDSLSADSVMLSALSLSKTFQYGKKVKE